MTTEWIPETVDNVRRVLQLAERGDGVLAEAAAAARFGKYERAALNWLIINGALTPDDWTITEKGARLLAILTGGTR